MSSIQQHEPLRVPSGWSGQEKQLIVQLEEILDDLYSRFNRLKLSDMDKSIRDKIITDIYSVQADIAIISKAHLTDADISWALIENLTAAIADISKAHLTDASIDWATISNLTTNIANIANTVIETADIDWANIKDMITQEAIITMGEAGQLYISRLGVTEANMVYLTVGELVVKGEDGTFYTVSVDENGSVVAEQKLVNNDDIDDHSINGGQKIIEGSITAETLNVQNIFGDNAIIRQLIAANLDVDTLFARQATIDSLNTIDITGNESISLYVQGQKDIQTWVRVTEDGLEIGKPGDPARFRADNRTLEVTNIKTERLGITQSMNQDEEWAWIATNTGLGLKYLG